MTFQKNILKYGFMLLVAGISMSLISCKEDKGGGSVDLKYKVTIEVQTPEGIKTGSAVRGYKARTYYNNLNNRYQLEDKIYGEAVVVDLGKRGKLFGVVSYKRNDSQHFAEAFSKRIHLQDPEWINDLQNLKIGQKASGEPDLKLMAGFYDIQDPQTVQFMNEREECIPPNPHEQCWKTIDYTEKLFGKNVFVKSVIYEVTDEPLTNGEIYKFLPWLKEYEKNRLRFDGFPIEYDNKEQNRRFKYLGIGAFNHKLETNGDNK